MINPLQRFAAWATAWTYSDLRRAHLKLSLIYIAIIATVIVVFSGIILIEVQREFDASSLSSGARNMLSEEETRGKVMALYPGADIIETDIEFVGGSLVENVLLEDDREVRVDLFTGAVKDMSVGRLSLYELLTDDIDEIIVWFALLIFIAASFGSIIIARATLEPIAEKMREQDAFIANTAHELRNPLAAVSASLQGLMRVSPENKTEFQETLKGIRAEHERLIQLSEDILRLSEAGTRKRGGETDVVVKDRISHIIQSLTAYAKERGVTLESEASQKTLRMRERDLDLIIFNLLHNAIKFSRPGQKVIVRWDDAGKLIVKDEGIGIGNDAKEHIFDRFYKVDASRTFTQGSGSGLGLSVVKEIVESVGARITVLSAEGKGTTITIQFLQ